MNNQVTIFNNPQFGEIRTAGTADNPLFCLADVCSALGLSAKGVNQRLNKEVISNYPLETAGGIQQALFVNEDGLYDVILDSRKPEAKAFRKWVTGDVLPTIRKTGGYITATPEMSDAEILSKAVLVAQTTIANRETRIKQLENENAEQKTLIQQMQKGNDYLNVILQSKGTLTTTQIAADYGITAVKFNKKLNEMRIQHKVNGQWILYSNLMGKGYVHSKTISFYHSDGRPDTRLSTEWTQRGRMFLYDALKEIGILPLIERN